VVAYPDDRAPPTRDLLNTDENVCLCVSPAVGEYEDVLQSLTFFVVCGTDERVLVALVV
jgi:hypothetical protein